MKILLSSLLLAVFAAVVAPQTLASPVGSIRVSGTIQAVSPTSLQLEVSGGQSMTFRLVATTAFVEDGLPVGLSALNVGEAARVKYHEEANGSLKAKEVSVKPSTGPASPPVIVKGTLLSVSPDTVAVKPAAGGADLSFRLDAGTIFMLQGKAAVSGDLRPGQRLEVKYRVEPNGSLKAQKIKILAAPAVAFVLEGTLVAAGATSLRVRVEAARESGAPVPTLIGRTIVITLAPGSRVTENGRAKRGGALAVDDRVHVTGLVAGDAYAAQTVRARIARKH